MGEIRDMLLKTYLKKGVKAPVKPAVAPKLKPIKVDRPRTVGDISIAMAAQKIYSPQSQGMVPPMAAPNKAMIERGAGPAMELDNSYLGKK